MDLACFPLFVKIIISNNSIIRIYGHCNNCLRYDICLRFLAKNELKSKDL